MCNAHESWIRSRAPVSFRFWTFDWVAFLSAGTHAQAGSETTAAHLRDLATTGEVSTRTLGAGLVSGICEVIDPVGTVHESRVLET